MNSYSHEELSKLSEDDLKRHCLNVRSEINKRKRIKKDATDLEIYFCYIIRELQNRAARASL